MGVTPTNPLPFSWRVRPPSQGPLTSARAGQVVGVDDRVRVALLGQEPLPVRGVLRVEGVARDDRVEVRLPPVGLGAQHPAEPLRLLLPRAERAATPGSATAASGRSIEKLRDLARPPASSISPVRNASKSRSRSLFGVEPWMIGASQQLAELVELVEVGADDQHLVVRVPVDDRAGPPAAWCARSRRPGSGPRARRSAYVIRSASVSVTRTSVHSAGAIQPCDSMSFHGAS